jgi:hypothetical protein
MWNRLNKLERRILLTASVLSLLFLLLLLNDSWLDFNYSTNTQQEIGTVIEKANDVRYKRATKFMWRKARSKISLSNGDSIFTGANSKSKIQLKDGSILEIEENSLIVFNTSPGENQLDFKYRVLSGSMTVTDKENKKITIEDPVRIAKKQIEKNIIEGKAKSTDSSKSNSPQVTKLAPPKITFPTQNYKFEIKFDDLGNSTSTRIIKTKWKGFNKNAEFEYQLATDSDFNQLLANQIISQNEFFSPELSKGNHFIRVREKLNSQVSAWSKVVAFEVIENRPEPLAAPILVRKNIQYKSPSEQPPIFAWRKVDGAAQYIFEISRFEDFSTKAELKVNDLNFKWKKFEKGDFYFRVYATKKNGYPGKISETGKITVLVEKPILSPVEPKEIFGKSPEDPGDPQEFKLEWSSQPLADKYEIQVSENEDFSAPIKLETSNPSSPVTIEKPGTFKWRVRPLDQDGKPLSGFSSPGAIVYNLKVPLASPQLIEPAENITLYFQKNLPQVFWLEWGSVRQAEAYKLEVSQNLDFTNPIVNELVKDTRYLIQKRLPQGKLYWRVMAIGTDRTSHWSSTRRMSVFAGKTAKIHNREDE